MVARRGPPPRLGICYDAGPRAAVRARLRPGDATVPLRRERPVRLAPKCRGRDHRPVPDRPAGASHVGADRRRRARPEGECADAGRLRVGAACWAREAPVGIEPTNRGFADLCLTTWLRRRGTRKWLEHYAFSTHRDQGLVRTRQLGAARFCPRPLKQPTASAVWRATKSTKSTRE